MIQIANIFVFMQSVIEIYTTTANVELIIIVSFLYIVLPVNLFSVKDRFIMKHIWQDNRSLQNSPFEDTLKAFLKAQKRRNVSKVWDRTILFLLRQMQVPQSKYAELYKKKMNVPNSVEFHFMTFPCFGGAICMGIQKKNQSHYAVNSCHYSNNG